MYQEFYYDSKGKGRIHGCKWTPGGEVRAVVQVLHGIAEFVERYEDLANYLNGRGVVLVGEDHMGHGKTMDLGGVQGYFHGGWMTAVADSCQLLEDTKKEYPHVPYFLFGHSMGSFMARTILCKYPDSGIAGAIICGTGWQPAFALPAMAKLIEIMGRKEGEEKPNETLQTMIFGGYNNRIKNPRTAFDWLSRDNDQVDAYVAHPRCGFTASAGLLRDMMLGIHYIQQKENLQAMKKDLPVFFIAGGEDPVGSYGKGVEQAAAAFRKAGMKDVSMKLYPQCRHEILNELNRDEVYADVLAWMEEKI